MAAKKKNSNKVKRRKKSRPAFQPKRKFEVEPPVDKYKKPISIFNKYWKVFTGCIIVITFGITVYNFWPKSDKEKFDEDYTIKGKLESPEISESAQVKNTPNFNFDEKNDLFPKIHGIYIKDLNKYPEVYFDLGSNTFGYSPARLKEGVSIDAGTALCVNSNLTVATKGDRLFVSAVFKDIDSENEVGYMEFNHWTLYKGTFLDYHPDPDDRKFEVLDKKGNILFSIAFSIIKGSPSLKISGYFVDDKNAMIVNGIDRDERNAANPNHTLGYYDCYSKTDSNWKQKALIAIKKIKSVF